MSTIDQIIAMSQPLPNESRFRAYLERLCEKKREEPFLALRSSADREPRPQPTRAVLGLRYTR